MIQCKPCPFPAGPNTLNPSAEKILFGNQVTNNILDRKPYFAELCEQGIIGQSGKSLKYKM